MDALFGQMKRSEPAQQSYVDQLRDTLAFSHTTILPLDGLSLNQRDVSQPQWQYTKFKMISSKDDMILRSSNVAVIGRIGTNDSLQLEDDEVSRQIESSQAVQELRRSHFEVLRKEPSLIAPSLAPLQEELQLQQNRQAHFSFKSITSQVSREYAVPPSLNSLNQDQKNFISANPFFSNINEQSLFSETLNDRSITTQVLAAYNNNDQQPKESQESVLNKIEQSMRQSVDFQGEKISEWICESIEADEPTNYVEKFIFHKKYKDFESEELKYKGESRFHNLNRIFMHTIIKILSVENLTKYNVPVLILQKITSIVAGIKKESFKRYNNGNTKTCFFNHCHYNILFLRINQESLRRFQGNTDDLDLHRSIIGVALSGEEVSPLNSQDVAYCNILKQYIYCVVRKTITANIAQKDYQNFARYQYVLRVLTGIQKLSQGFSVRRF